MLYLLIMVIVEDDEVEMFEVCFASQNEQERDDRARSFHANEMICAECEGGDTMSIVVAVNNVIENRV